MRANFTVIVKYWYLLTSSEIVNFILPYLAWDTACIGIYIIRIRQSHDPLIFVMEITTLWKTIFILKRVQYVGSPIEQENTPVAPKKGA